MIGLSNRIKRNRRLLIRAAILITVIWWFNYSVIIPICMSPSKPVTMYLKWNEKYQANGTPRRITFRIPSAYLLPLNSPARRGSGYHEGIGFEFDKDNELPACLLKKEQSDGITKNYKISVSIKPGKALNLPDSMEDYLCTSHQQVISDVKGFIAHKNGAGKCYVPEDKKNTKVIFDCMFVDGPRGCMAWTSYKGMRVQYIFNHSQLSEWHEVHDKVLRKIDSFISDIDS